MNTITGGLLVALSSTMLAFSSRAGYVPVSPPTYRVYRAARPAYFWTLIGCYALIGVIGLRTIMD